MSLLLHQQHEIKWETMRRWAGIQNNGPNYNTESIQKPHCAYWSYTIDLLHMCIPPGVYCCPFIHAAACPDSPIQIKRQLWTVRSLNFAMPLPHGRGQCVLRIIVFGLDIVYFFGLVFRDYSISIINQSMYKDKDESRPVWIHDW